MVFYNLVTNNRIHLTNLFDIIIYEEYFNINIGRGFKT